MTDEQNIQTSNELEEIKKKSEEYLNNWKRTAADFINYKKDEAERAKLLISYAKEDMFLNFLPVLDSIYLMEQHIKKQPEQTDKLEFVGLSQGIELIKKQIADVLKQEGIEEIATEGQPFNPETMEIVEQTEGGQTGTVAEELQKGYSIGGKVIRPAKVKVSK